MPGDGTVRILISACLLGRRVRYNGSDKTSGYQTILNRWAQEGWLVPLCPEIAVGFPTPRPPAEIQGSGGTEVLEGHARIVEDTGRDVTALYQKAAEDAVSFARRNGCQHAVLTDGSPSCGSSVIYDGSFKGVQKAGMGSTTAALRRSGVRVWSEKEIPELDRVLKALHDSQERR